MDEEQQTKAEFDSWIRRWRDLKEKLVGEKVKVYPSVDFGTENIRSPIVVRDTDFFVSRKNRYLSELTDSSCQWAKDPASAKLFSYDEAMNRLAGRGKFLLKGAILVRSPKAKDVPKAIIMVVDAFDNQNYVYKAKAHSLQITQYKENAYQYSSPQVAQTALKRILSKYPKIQHAEVFVL